MKKMDIYNIVTFALEAAKDDNGVINGIAYDAAVAVAMYMVKSEENQARVAADLQLGRNILEESDFLEEEGELDKEKLGYTEDELQNLSSYANLAYKEQKEYENSVTFSIDDLRKLISKFTGQLNELVTPENIAMIQEFAEKWGKGK